jgi:acetyltransferase-like isoleucine patch superfamily enzyme
MNKIERTWLTWKHQRKFARLGKRCQYPIPQLCVRGHVEMGDRCRFRNDVTLLTHGDGKIIFGNRSGLSWGCTAEAHELIQIGNYTAIAEFSYICDSMPVLVGDPAAPGEMKRITKPIYIGDNVFVTIGDSAVVGPYSVVTKDIGPLEIWAGVPARRVGHRTEGVSESQLESFRELVAEQGIQEDRYTQPSQLEKVNRKLGRFFTKLLRKVGLK